MQMCINDVMMMMMMMMIIIRCEHLLYKETLSALYNVLTVCLPNSLHCGTWSGNDCAACCTAVCYCHPLSEKYGPAITVFAEIPLTDGGVGLQFQMAVTFHLRADFPKHCYTNWDHCVKVSSWSCLFPCRRSVYRFRWEDGIRRRKRKNRVSTVSIGVCVLQHGRCE